MLGRPRIRDEAYWLDYRRRKAREWYHAHKERAAERQRAYRQRKYPKKQTSADQHKEEAKQVKVQFLSNGGRL